uniref:Uncharacterized protein n=1 Tax=Nelumbo nucifera TaxID=4432 RepID=A0A822YP12_NELNU|nr:TPA_asm: hypothetical protein HUJ06_011920 [Nelumbo nucifera]
MDFDLDRVQPKTGSLTPLAASGFKWNSGLGPLHSTNKGLSSIGKLSRSRPFSGILGLVVGHLLGGGNEDDRHQQADESLQKVMYLNC